MTNIVATLLFPMSLPEPADLGGMQWVPGPAYSGDAPHVSGPARLANYSNTELLEQLLSPQMRSHRIENRQHGRVVLEASELLRLPEWIDTGNHFLIWHLRPTAEVTGDQFLADIALLARTGREEFRTFLQEMFPELPMPAVPQSPRMPSLVLSGPPGDSEGLFDWPGSSASARRLADMVTLPDYRRETTATYVPEQVRPTPSHVAAVSGTALGVLRLRPLRDSQILEMRTLWLDAFLLEVVCSEAVSAMETSTTKLAIRGDRKQWSTLEDQFRKAKSVWLSRTTSDHPMETGIGSLVRQELKTDARLASLREELDSHAGHLARRAGENLNIAVGILALLTAIVPLLLFVGDPGNSWDAPAFLAACAVSVVLIAGALWIWARRNR